MGWKLWQREATGKSGEEEQADKEEAGKKPGEEDCCPNKGRGRGEEQSCCDQPTSLEQGIHTLNKLVES